MSAVQRSSRDHPKNILTVRELPAMLRYFKWIAVAALYLFALMVSLPAKAQTFTLLHNFTGADGSSPTAGVTLDQGGNLYGTMSLGGHTGGHCFNGCGTVYKLSFRNSNWIFTPLYLFSDSDG